MDRINAAGHRSLLLLLILLPFDPAQHRWFQASFFAATTLRLAFVAVALLATITVVQMLRAAKYRRDRVRVPSGRAVRPPPGKGFGPPRGVQRFRNLAVLCLLAAVVVTATISTFMSGRDQAGFAWIADLLMAGLIVAALPAWLAAGGRGRAVDARIGMLGAALVAGAVLAALFGFAELFAGVPFDRQLTWFKSGPTLMGPYLRLSGPFGHANTAAMYFELALPFALVGLVSEFSRNRIRWVPTLAWTTATDILLVAILLTFCRGALVGTVAAIVVMAAVGRALFSRMSRRQLFRSLLGAGANPLLVCMLFLIPTASVSALRLSGESDTAWYRVVYSATLPTMMHPGQDVKVRVTVRNLSPLDWAPVRKRDYQLSYHWLYSSHAVAQFSTTYTPLPHPVPAGGRNTVFADVRAPAAPGQYLLIWDVLWHSSIWFGLKTGGYVPAPVHVAGPAVADPSPRPGGAPDLGAVTALPIADTPSREHIWQVALDTIGQHPVLGNGPHGFREAYAATMLPQPGVSPGSPPVHAHDLVLEVLADWGILGGGLFLGLLALLWWPRLKRGILAAAGRNDGAPIAGWEIAVLGAGSAFLAHSTVDYFLGVTSIFVVFAILTGLASMGIGREV